MGMDEKDLKILERKGFQFFIDLGLLGLCYYYTQVGLAVRAGTLETYILLKACASEKGIPEIVEMSEEAILLFG
ncbi:hypothetical protein BaRGS_00003516 [Batillaria attramentaria]|uniref:Uncharacterized protein n=1 Tax=Batillaria attramentaria TaxID=370345 RepID=A0ABD0M084_9CAEN